jgi:hypothetical protein
MFKKINGPFEFIGPARIRYLSSGFIDHDERARKEQWIHKPILRSDEAIAMFLKFQRLQEQKRQSTPALNHTAKIGGTAKIDARIEGQGQQYFPPRAGLEGGQVRFFPAPTGQETQRSTRASRKTVLYQGIIAMSMGQEQARETTFVRFSEQTRKAQFN